MPEDGIMAIQRTLDGPANWHLCCQSTYQDPLGPFVLFGARGI